MAAITEISLAMNRANETRKATKQLGHNRQSPSKIPVVMRGLAVMQTVALSEGGATCAEVAEQLQLPKSSVHRMLQQLVDLQYLQKNQYANFSLTMLSHQLAHDILLNDHFYASRHEILKALSQKVKETCNCTIQDGFEIVYYDRVESNWPIRIQLPTGSKLPMYCTASGKLFLAFMTKDKRQQFFNTVELQKHTANTITDKQILQQQLAEIRRNKIAVDSEEFISGMVSVAVPVFYATNKMAYTLAIHAPSIRSSIEQLRQKLPELHQAAAKMQTLMQQHQSE